MAASTMAAMGTHTTEPEVFSSTHQFTIAGFSLEKTKGVRNAVRSGVFEVGGYSWTILCYPTGKEERGRGYVSAYLQVARPAGAKFKLKFCITIIGPGGKRQPIVYCWWNRWVESASDANELSWGNYHAISLRSVESEYLVDDRLTLSCTVHVQKLEAASTASRSIIKVPPPGIGQDIARLLESKLGSDVTFQVDSNHYDAHRAVVASRSPVFAAQFFGPLADGSVGRCVRIHDMAPVAFEAVLHFIYTDTLPPVNDDESVSTSCTELGETMERRRDMVYDWLAAADRYGLERMRLLCENVLWETIHVANAAATLEIADRHHCQQPKSFCIDYIATPKVLPGVLATDGYKELKLNSPLLVADILEKFGRVC
ncbi:hypothetical protein ACQJBY_035240 [Aegilops geniculata]